jgi:protein-disulfide isomerase
LVLAVPVYLALLGPGAKTPHARNEELSVSGGASAGGMTESEFKQAFGALEEREQLFMSYARAQWVAAKPGDASAYPVRARLGPADAPVKVVDFTDILCGHCRAFEQVEGELEKAAPPGSLSFEPRYFPLDGECNAQVQKTVGDGIRCLGAKVQLCLEGTPAFSKVRHDIFENQQSLTKDKVLEFAVKGSGRSADELMACVNSPETTAKLNQDIEYAMRFHISGTPLILVNGKESQPAPMFLLGMAIAKGDANSSVFSTFPPPPTPP